DVEPILAPPPRIKAKYGVKVAEVQLIAHELGKIDFYADFARRAAYHLGLPCSSTIKLPTDIQRWTVLRSPFVHKSSLENFERRTHKRQLTIKDGDVEVVKKWVDYIKVNMPTSLACRVRYYTYETL
ncbi:ribosomal protein S10, partial [Ramicandelaber brevisporus]